MATGIAFRTHTAGMSLTTLTASADEEMPSTP